jgi:hypothetical protein
MLRDGNLGYAPATKDLVTNAEKSIKQNNEIDLFEEYFAGESPEHLSETINTKTVMIAALSPADYNYEETLSTLHYANRAKSIKNKPRINEDPKDALLKEYEQEIKQLRALLAQLQTSGATGAQMGVAIAAM